MVKYRNNYRYVCLHGLVCIQNTSKLCWLGRPGINDTPASMNTLKVHIMVSDIFLQ